MHIVFHFFIYLINMIQVIAFLETDFNIYINSPSNACFSSFLKPVFMIQHLDGFQLFLVVVGFFFLVCVCD